jgi:hypothetical protein
MQFNCFPQTGKVWVTPGYLSYIFTVNATMTTQQQKQVAISAITVASIILIRSLLPWLMDLFAIPQSRAVHIPLFLLFPHEVLGSLKNVLVLLINSYQLSLIPLFSILFAIFLLMAAQQFRNRQHKRPLAIACSILLLSMLIAIPDTITGYQKLVVEYNNYKPSPNKGGILGLIDNFTAVQKPSLSLLIAQLLILLLYMGWAIWVLNRLYAAKHK